MTGVDPNKSFDDMVVSNINQRIKIDISSIDIFLYKYMRCNFYSLFKGPKFYLGKIVFEGEQRIKNEADFGNLIQIIRRGRVLSQCLLDKESFFAMKLQRGKLLDAPQEQETPSGKKMFIDDDSEINNEASIQDLRDYT